MANFDLLCVNGGRQGYALNVNEATSKAMSPERETSPTFNHPTQNLEAYRQAYPVKSMRRPENNTDELIQMELDQGMNELPSPPANTALFPRHSTLPASEDSAKEARHLWVIRSNDVPVALEECSWGKTLESQCIKHSNLTGGSAAHSGGEMWFIDHERIAINASSGRYGAESNDELQLIVQALRRSGYYVASMGFDLDNPTVPNTIFVGEPEWETPL